MMTTLTEVINSKTDKTIQIDNDIIFIWEFDPKLHRHYKFQMHPDNALVEALNLLGLNCEYV